MLFPCKLVNRRHHWILCRGRKKERQEGRNWEGARISYMGYYLGVQCLCFCLPVCLLWNLLFPEVTPPT